MLQLARAIVGVASEVLRLVVLFLRSSGAIRAENLVLRKQHASYIEHGIKRFRLSSANIRVRLNVPRGVRVAARCQNEGAFAHLLDGASSSAGRARENGAA